MSGAEHEGKGGQAGPGASAATCFYNAVVTGFCRVLHLLVEAPQLLQPLQVPSPPNSVSPVMHAMYTDSQGRKIRVILLCDKIGSQGPKVWSYCFAMKVALLGRATVSGCHVMLVGQTARIPHRHCLQQATMWVRHDMHVMANMALS